LSERAESPVVRLWSCLSPGLCHDRHPGRRARCGVCIDSLDGWRGQLTDL